MASLMDARLRRLNARFNPTSSPEAMLAAMAEHAAREFDLEPQEVLAEALVILEDMRGMTIDAYLVLHGVDPAEAQREASKLLADMDAARRGADPRHGPTR